VFRAVTPALAASGGMWVGVSTGYRKLGLLYQKWRDHFGQNSDDILFVEGASRQFNSLLDQAVIDRARESDPEAAEAEWFGGFRSDISSFLDDEIIEKVVDYARPLEIPPRQGIQYSAFCDPSGGRHDHFCLCIGHREGKGTGSYFVADVVRGVAPPFDPESVVAEFATLLKDYKVHTLPSHDPSFWIIVQQLANNFLRKFHFHLNHQLTHDKDVSIILLPRVR
jgi:hypothetical protein